MQVKLWKDYKILFLIIFGFVCFFININNADALVYKGPGRNDNIDNSVVSGVLNNSSATHIEINVNSPINNNYDYIAFKLVRFNFNNSLYYTNETQSAIFCSPMTYNANTNGYYCNTNTVTNLAAGIEVVATEPSITNSVYLYGNNTDSFCTFSSEYEDYIICPITNNTSVSKISFDITSYNQPSNVNTYYSINISKSWIYLNNDSKEIVNAIMNQATTTNQNIQIIQQQNTQQQQYLENDNTTGTQQQVNTDIANTSSELSTASNSVNDLTNIIMSPLTLFMDLSTSSCTPIHLVVPFVNTSFDLPCMSTIYNAYFSTFLTIFTTVIASITCYWISINTIKLIKELLDCDNDRIEVLDL